MQDRTQQHDIKQNKTRRGRESRQKYRAQQNNKYKTEHVRQNMAARQDKRQGQHKIHQCVID